MANPSKGNSLLADRNGAPLLGSAQTLVADTAALTATAITAPAATAVATTGVTQTTPYGYAGATQGDAVATAINLLVTHTTELDLDYEALRADVIALRTTVLAALDVLEAHGLMRDA